MVVPDVEGVGRDQVVAFQHLHVVHLKPGPEPISLPGPGDYPVRDQPWGAQQQKVAELETKKKNVMKDSKLTYANLRPLWCGS